MLELALWRAKMNELKSNNPGRRTKKKVKVDESDFRNQCRISCGADIVIEHVLPYLLPAAAKEGNNATGEVDSSGGEEDINEEGDSSEGEDDSMGGEL